MWLAALGLCGVGVVSGRMIMSCGGGGPESCADLTTPELRAAHGKQLGCGFASQPTLVCSPREVTGAVDDGCGIFVHPEGSPTGAGTKADPVNTFEGGIALLTRRWPRLYLCEGTFTQVLVVPQGVQVYGGLDCSTWARIGDGAKTKITAAPGEIPMVLEGGTDPVVVEDVYVLAADATAPGGSSIGALVLHAEATLRNVVIEAGDAQPGLDGAAMPDAQAGSVGADGINACTAHHVLGGEETMNRCGEIVSVGGAGGSGEVIWGQHGKDGLPHGADNGGKGELTDPDGGPPSPACQDGTAGNDGIQGESGKGGSGLGLVYDKGYRGLPGLPGLPGKPGQGGGGGGGSEGEILCLGKMWWGGPGGGGGGSGGCGGLGGEPGGYGGSSIGVIAMKATFTFEDVVIKAKNAGRGGHGGLGQVGGMPGAGGLGGSTSTPPFPLNRCDGGPGGSGGSGGRGGGGTGGHSVAVAFTGPSPLAAGVTMTTGAPGMGGDGDGPMGTGSAGIVADAHAF